MRRCIYLEDIFSIELMSIRDFKDRLSLIKDKIFALEKALKIDFNKNNTYKSGYLIRIIEDTITFRQIATINNTLY